MIPTQPEEDPFAQNTPVMPMYAGSTEGQVTNIVGQIDPQTIIDNLDHALKGEQFNKEQGAWVSNDTGEALVNDACRGAVISYVTSLLANNTTMGHIDEKRLGYIMEGVIETITRTFNVNLEKYGFVPAGDKFKDKIYYNRGTPDTARMTAVSNMVYMVCFLVLTRALKGNESSKIFRSLTLSDSMGYGGGMQQEKKSWLGKVFGK